MAYLEIHKGRTVVHSPLADEANSIGRQAGNSIVINDKDVSRQHCVIEKWDGAYSIHDVGSRNGTVVNGERVERTQLRSGDVITIGGTIAKFIDAPMKSGASDRKKRRGGWLIWFPAITVLLATALVVAWALGLIGGDTTLRDIRNRLGLTPPTAPRSVPTATPEAAPALPGTPDNTPPAATDESAASADVSSRVEPSGAAMPYKTIDRHASIAELDGMLGQFVAARFIGSPTRDDRGRMTWELPPDGTVLAIFEPDAPAAANILKFIESEPAMLVAEVAGRLSRDSRTGGFVLRVGVIEVLQPLSGGSVLADQTHDLIGKRVVINARYAAASDKQSG